MSGSKVMAPFAGGAVLAVLVVAGIGCRSGEPVAPADSAGNCVVVGGTVANDILGRSPFAELPEELRVKVQQFLAADGRVCLSAGASATRCNAGDARDPDLRTCCQFSDEPSVALSGLAKRIDITGDDATRVELQLKPVIQEKAESRLCRVPTCDDDRASAKVALAVRGQIRRGSEKVDVAIDLELDRRLDFRCRLP